MSHRSRTFRTASAILLGFGLTLHALSASAQTSHQQRIEAANNNTVSIVSGNPNGTYLRIAYDISAVVDNKADLRVLPIVGKAAVQNVMDLLYLRGIDMAITQSNILSFFRTRPEAGNVERRMVYITKLFNEELHIYARSEFKSLKDLQGRRVNFSDAGSGTEFSAHQLFDAFGVTPVKANMGQADAIEAMRRGELDATILIAGKPNALFQTLAGTDDFHFIGVDYLDQIADEYFPAELTHDDYPNIIAEGQSIDTIAVGAILVAYDWPEGNERRQRLEKFIDTFFSSIQEFRQAPRHPKWSETNLAAEVPAMRRFEPAARWLARNARPVERTGAAIQDDFDRFLEKSGMADGTPEKREALFQEFLEWRSRTSSQ